MPRPKGKGMVCLLASPINVSALLLTLVLAATAEADDGEGNHFRTAKLHCEGTLYPSLCVSTLSAIPSLTSKPLRQVISAAVNRTVDEVYSSSANCSGILQRRSRHLDRRQRIALKDCLELLGDTVDGLRAVVSDLSSPTNASRHYDDLQTLLSAAITNQYTCLDGFAYVNASSVRPYIERRLRRISRHVSNLLTMAKKIKRRGGRSLAEDAAEEPFEGYGKVARGRGGFPSWLTWRDRRLLQIAANGTNPDLVVAKDGSGNFTTIGEAVAAAPNNSNSRFVIYIKAGAYFENVDVDKKKTNLMFVGDGIGKTVVKGNRNVVDGWTTFRSATVAVVGNGFLARDITIENYAGPSKHQAVALRSGSDLSAFYRCSFVGYQDTLYVHSLRQFYRECDVYGTVDFIFGDASVVIQRSNLYARKPNDNQRNIYTAQGRQDPNQNTGIAIQGCKVAAAADLIPVQSSFKTYLGRPWKEYSRTVIMQSYLGDLIDPAGWLEWSGSFALSTLYYGEYLNRGPGSNTTGRVTWPGYRVINNATEATRFTVGSFIQGGEWLAATTIPFSLGLE
ncbi:hypothetical protein Taro_032304 [Colocasia esculenta]|uniref:Pectinesterase n=1 Tax=Colocasia esculenta TaxID=4460 RepID=A0A843W929_COLES|nr:hypothetical protein [Colocasia esculenta]